MCLPGTTYLVTRTCANRRYLLRPSPVVNEVVRYCAARAARDYRVELHAIAVQANHQHIVLTDFGSDLSDFMHAFNRSVALCLMEHYANTHPQNTLEGIWSKGHFSAVILTTPNAVIDKVVYTLTNPVKDALVVDYKKWPGWISKPSDWLKPDRLANRPTLFFSQRDDQAAHLPYRFTVPPMLRDQDLRQLTHDVEALIRDRQRQWHSEHASGKRRVIGVNAVLALDPFDAPDRARARAGINPRLAATGEPRSMLQAQSLLRRFRIRYRTALAAFRVGLRVTFPAGTLLMQKRYAIECESFVPSWCVHALACAAPS